MIVYPGKANYSGIERSGRVRSTSYGRSRSMNDMMVCLCPTSQEFKTQWGLRLEEDEVNHQNDETEQVIISQTSSIRRRALSSLSLSTDDLTSNSTDSSTSPNSSFSSVSSFNSFNKNSISPNSTSINSPDSNLKSFPTTPSSISLTDEYFNKNYQTNLSTSDITSNYQQPSPRSDDLKQHQLEAQRDQESRIKTGSPRKKLSSNVRFLEPVSPLEDDKIDSLILKLLISQDRFGIYCVCESMFEFPFKILSLNNDLKKNRISNGIRFGSIGTTYNYRQNCLDYSSPLSNRYHCNSSWRSNQSDLKRVVEVDEEGERKQEICLNELIESIEPYQLNNARLDSTLYHYTNIGNNHIKHKSDYETLPEKKQRTSSIRSESITNQKFLSDEESLSVLVNVNESIWLSIGEILTKFI
ncbi:hypothetical protein BY996DRAFT_6627258 [Phakopsora pachyrhizi]|uniref:Expressed protein n=1 Tax=Phakopsora pachyrhizi TaxID=170000 RepID=A0AAV0AKT6_PHAPC|nr:hypothetical protein BY996DRAFT_6627258 [Phakopsora pachyrhizi]CAH7668999.1 expressed protein [Phakopsora pachyrhizi]